MATSGQIECPECGKHFRRLEHMKRHQISHAVDKPFQCEKCSRAFNRSDALQRHQLIHTQQGPNLLQKRARACYRCASARVRCDAETPQCTRCAARQLDCSYPPARTGTQESSNGMENTDGGPASPSTNRSIHPSRSESDQQSPITGREYAAKTPRSSSSQTFPTGTPNMSHTNGSEESAYGSDQHFLQGNRIEYPSPTVHTTGTMIAGPQQPYRENIRSGSMTSNAPLQAPMPPIHPGNPLPAMNEININSYNYPDNTYGQPSPSANSFGFEFENSGILSNLNWLPLETGLIDQGISPIDINSASWTQQFNPFPSEVAGPATNSLPRITPFATVPPSIASHGQSLAHESPSGGQPSQATSSSKETTASGEYYLDGDGARLPRIKRRRLHSRSSVQESNTKLSLHLREGEANAHNHAGQRFEIGAAVHELLFQLFEHNCIDTSPGIAAYSSQSFPSPETLSHHLGLYFEHFHPVFPLIHAPTFVPTQENHLLVAAMAAIGSHYEESVESAFVYSMHTYVRRAIQATDESYIQQDSPAMELVQAKLLNVVGMLHCGDDRMFEEGLGSYSKLPRFCVNNWHQQAEPGHGSNKPAVFEETSWESWIASESKRRTGYFIWLLDTLLAFHFNQRPYLVLEDANEALPCHEKLWEARTASDWLHQTKRPYSPQTLLAALEDMYVEKRLNHHTGEFSRVLLIHGLFRRNWEVEAYLRQPFARWEPSAHTQGRREVTSSRTIWMPADQTYSRWRNATCDCLDILHWSANATIGRQSGMEHPTVLHLHLARVVLLTPFKSIVALAKSNNGTRTPRNAHDKHSDRHIVQLWANSDQYKARLAMIHAGVLFWHVRRYSSNAFYEPSSVLLATLALWAYSSFAKRRTPPSRPESQTQTSSSSHSRTRQVPAATPSTHQGPHSPAEASSVSASNSPNADQNVDDEELPLIHLDRPTDDELVQMFVKFGGRMHANVTGVGDIHGPNGPARVLWEGRKLLGTLECWGIGRQMIEVLDGVIEAETQG